MIKKEGTATIKDYGKNGKKKFIRYVGLPVDVEVETNLNHQDKAVYEEVTEQRLKEIIKTKSYKGMFLFYKKESVENVNL